MGALFCPHDADDAPQVVNFGASGAVLPDDHNALVCILAGGAAGAVEEEEEEEEGSSRQRESSGGEEEEEEEAAAAARRRQRRRRRRRRRRGGAEVAELEVGGGGGGGDGCRGRRWRASGARVARRLAAAAPGQGRALLGPEGPGALREEEEEGGRGRGRCRGGGVGGLKRPPNGPSIGDGGWRIEDSEGMGRRMEEVDEEEAEEAVDESNVG